MSKVKQSALALSLALITTPATAVDIPVVPMAVMKTDVPAPVKPKTASKSIAATSAQPSRESEALTLTMKPGVNELVPVAIGHLNRIVTPFDAPQVTTTSDATTEVRDNVVYVATSGEAPVTMFITDKGSEAQALSITLLPRKIAPREVALKMEGGLLVPGRATNARAQKWEQSQPYVDTVRSVFRMMALGEVPQGYTMNEMPLSIALPRCSHPGIAFDFASGQMLMGHHLTVQVGVAKNISNQPVEIKESACGNWDVAAVAVWPNNVLEPGQLTEVYVAKKQKRGAAPTSKRPSLLEVGQ